MKRYLIFMLSLLMLAASIPVFAQQSEGAKVIAQFKYPDLKWSVPEVGKDVQRTELDNGMIVYLMEDHRLPMLNVTALVRCGEAYVADEDMAIPEITGDVMRTGGTTHIAPDSLNALLESIGGSLPCWNRSAGLSNRQSATIMAGRRSV